MAQSSQLAAFALDDFESRSGSATSILRTIAGLYLRHARTSVTRSQAVTLAGAAGIGAAAAQTALSRLVERGLLESAGESQLTVSTPARTMFARGNRRIFIPRQMGAADRWLLVTYSLPETMRSVRHQLRRHFSQLGGGLVSSGLWIFPEYLQSEVHQVLDGLQARPWATLFVTDHPQTTLSPLEAASAWWDLGKLGQRHEAFIATVSEFDRRSIDGEESYRCYVALIDAWRAIPYLDPGLPPTMLPVHWPGRESRELFSGLSEVHREPAQRYAEQVLAPTDSSTHRIVLPHLD